MFSFFKKNTSGQSVTFKISGMHCPSCAMNIDGALEDEVEGVVTSQTNYAKSETIVQIKEGIDVQTLILKIKEIGYTAIEKSKA